LQIFEKIKKVESPILCQCCDSNPDYARPLTASITQR